MMQRLYRDERGDLSYFTIFVILAVNMLLAFVLLFAMVKINSINIRNAAKMELNNVSARIYADTFHSQREANLESYMKDLHLSHSYQEALRADFINSLKDRIDMENDNYTSGTYGWILTSMTTKLNTFFTVRPNSESICLAGPFHRLHSGLS